MPKAHRRWYRGAAGAVSATLLVFLSLLSLAPPGTALAGEAPATEPGELLFAKLHPDFIVNLRGAGSHFLMVTAQIQTRRPEDVQNALHHLPALRHELLMIMGELGFRDALSLEGRQKLAEDSLTAVRRVLDEETGGNAVEAILFTDYQVE